MSSRILKLMMIAMLSLWGHASRAELNVSIQPNPVIVNSTAQMVLKSDEGMPTIPALPNVPGIEWQDNGRPANSHSIQIVNGRRSAQYQAIFSFIIKKVGRVDMPSFEIDVNRKRHKVAAFTIQAVDAQVGANKVSDLIDMKVTFDGQESPPTTLYPGQMVHIRMELFIDGRVQLLSHAGHSASFVRPDNYFPTMNLKGDLIWRDYGAFNEHNRHFLYKDAVQRQVNGHVVRMFEYKATFRAMEPGTISGSIDHTVPVQTRSGGARDPFQRLMGGGGQVTQVPLKTPIPTIEVKPLPPPPPDDVPFVGLVGNWDVTFHLDKQEVTIGDDLTLIMKVTGSGNIEALSVPKWSLPGFNLYEPEISRNVQRDSVSGEAKWVIVPRTVKSGFPPLKVRTFDPVAAVYKTHQFAPELVVKPGEAGAISGPRIIESGDPTAGRPLEEQGRQAHDIIYIKEAPGKALERPLWRNRLPLLVVFFIAGPLAFVVFSGFAGRRLRLGEDTQFRRKQEALRQRSRLKKRLKQASDEELPELVRQELLPHAAAVLGLPPGTTIDELRKHVDDPDLLEILELAQYGGFMPGSKGQVNRDRVLKALSRLACWCLLLGIASTSFAASTLQEASSAYDQGDYEQAARLYEEEVEAQGRTAPLLYNLGNCAYAQGELGQAIAYFEEARRLAPRDSDIVENLNFVRSQLNLAPALEVTDPLTLAKAWRDYLRPDEWLIMAAICWLAFWLVAGLRKLQQWHQVWMLWVPAVAGLVCLILPLTQLTSTYSANQAVVTVDDAPVYRLPTDSEAQAKLKLDEAEYLLVVEVRTGWTRIRVGQVEGWVQANAVQRYW